MGYTSNLLNPRQAVSGGARGAGLEVPIWILGSSLYGAQSSGPYLGLPFAFASHSRRR